MSPRRVLTIEFDCWLLASCRGVVIAGQFWFTTNGHMSRLKKLSLLLPTFTNRCHEVFVISAPQAFLFGWVEGMRHVKGQKVRCRWNEMARRSCR